MVYNKKTEVVKPVYHELINYATKNYPFIIEHTDVKYIPHFHDETEIVMVMDGDLGVTLENKSFTLKKGEICIITPKMIHNLCSHISNTISVMKLYSVADLSNIRLDNPVVSPGSENYEQLRKYICDIMLENKNRTIGYELAVNILAEKIFLTVLRNMKYTRLEDNAQIKLANKSDFLNSVTEFLEEHYADSFILEDVAKHFNYTKSHFCHYFKKITGTTFWNYYTIFRLEKSIQIMQQYPNKKYIEVSESAGFRNIRSFNQAFKEHHSCTPSEYMKKHYLSEVTLTEDVR